MRNSPQQSRSEGPDEAPRLAFLRSVEAALERAFMGAVGLVRRHLLDIAVVMAVIGGLLLLYAETFDLYKIVTPGGVTSNARGSIQSASDQHSWALGVIGVVIAGSALLARWTRQRLPAWAAVVLAVAAVAIVLIGDLPDVTSSGLTTELESGDAQPQTGFWIELVGAVLALAGTVGLALQLSRGAVARQRPR
jgi:hypothetical protein